MSYCRMLILRIKTYQLAVNELQLLRKKSERIITKQDNNLS